MATSGSQWEKVPNNFTKLDKYVQILHYYHIRAGMTAVNEIGIKKLIRKKKMTND